MNNFEFYNPVKIIFGKGTIAKLREQLPRNARILMVYGGGSIHRNGIYKQVTDALNGFQYGEFSGIEPNPHYETCMKAVDKVHKEGFDFLLAVGGGSVIDATKFIAAAALCDGEPWDFFIRKKPVEKALPLGVILTLPATGSEMNERSIISRVETNQKLGLHSQKLYPKFSILDPETSYSLPKRQIANGVVDAFIHVVEQYLTYPVDSPVQDYYAEGLMRTLIDEGRKVLLYPNDYNVRANLMWAATNALNGLIGCGVPQDWSSHRMGYGLTTEYGMDHAQTLAIILPGVMEFKKKEKEQKILRMGNVLFNIHEGSVDERIARTIGEVERFFRHMGLKTRLSEVGLGEEAIEAVAMPIEKMQWKLGENENITAEEARKILRLRL
ncbi:MAG: iron-containing alcohol dehydrogenase [Bacteroidales bacterium]|nr:iron-containing alcohol dehydrogenase [Bacteroidales bacterium]